MSFTGAEDHSVTLADASNMTKEFRDSNPAESLGGFFGRDAIQAILDQPGCVGIRHYYAHKADGSLTIVLAGVESNQDDMENGVLAEYTRPVPPFGGKNNSLNS